MIDFPNNPSTNDVFTSGEKTWKYNGTSWVVVGVQARAVTWGEVLNKPTLSVAATDDSVYATAAQGAKADLAVAKAPADAVPVNAIRCLTQAEYDAIATKDANTLYLVT